MRTRGQSGLDLLLGLLILLIVLNVFSSVLVRFEEVQKEISIRQQLRENIFLMGVLASYSGGKFSDPRLYPPTNNLVYGYDLPYGYNVFNRSTGIVDLENIHAAGTQAHVPCTFAWDVNISNVNYYLLVSNADSGLPYDIDLNRVVSTQGLYDKNHLFLVSGCVDTFSIEAKP